MTSQSTIFQFDLNNQRIVECDYATIQYDFERYLYWIHVDLNHPTETSAILNKLNVSLDLFNINPRTELDEFFPFLNETDDALWFQIRCLSEQKLNRQQDATYRQMTLYLTESICITLSNGLPSSLVMLKKELNKALRYAITPGFVMFLIFDNVINEYLELLLEFERLAESVDLDFRHVTTSTYRKVIVAKKRIIKLKRYIAIIADMIMRLSGRKIHVISEQCRLSLLDLLSHCQMVVNEADAIRDAINSSLDSINNALMGRMNESIRILTVYTLFFMPLTLITGIYGMNFEHMPELSWRYGYAGVLIIMAICAACMIYVFKKLRWI